MTTGGGGTRFYERLLGTLGLVTRSGAVVVAGDMPLTMPGLEVDKVGTIALPLDKSVARRLIRECARAPYGKGTQTLVDTKVRRVWELDPDRFHLTNPRWNEVVRALTDEAGKGLDLGENKLTAHLYKLLVYEEGSFFRPHRDGEKLDGMVATLVVALPSIHQGGELVITHEGRRHEVAFSGAASGHELSYAAFYADCAHEVRPIREGYRICLVYNLALARGKRSIAAPRTGAVAGQVREILAQWPSEGSPKLAVVLEHQYTQEGLRVDTLKGVDRAWADVASTHRHREQPLRLDPRHDPNRFPPHVGLHQNNGLPRRRGQEVHARLGIPETSASHRGPARRPHEGNRRRARQTRGQGRSPSAGWREDAAKLTRGAFCRLAGQGSSRRRRFLNSTGEPSDSRQRKPVFGSQPVPPETSVPLTQRRTSPLMQRT